MVKSGDAIKDSPKSNVSTTTVINNDKNLDIPDFDEKSFCTTNPKERS